MKLSLAILLIAVFATPAFADHPVCRRVSSGPAITNAVASRKAVGPDIENAVVSRKAVGPSLQNAVVSRKVVGPRAARTQRSLRKLDPGSRAVDLNAGL